MAACWFRVSIVPVVAMPMLPPMLRIRFFESTGGPRAERVPGRRAGVSALPGPAGAPLHGAVPEPVAPALVDVLHTTHAG